MEIDPAEVLRPAHAAEWTTALLAAAEDVPADDRTRALGLAAALAVGLGESDRAAECLRLLQRCGALGQVIAAALAAGPDAPTEQQVAPLSPQERDWVVLQCYRADREVPPALAVGVDQAALAAMDQLAAIEALARAALTCDDPGAVVRGLSEWLSRADSDGLDHYIQRAVLAPVCRTVVRPGLRGLAQRIQPEQFGLLLRDCIDSEYRSEMYGEFAELADRLTLMGYHGLVHSLAEHSTGWGQYFDDIALASSLRYGRYDEAMAQFAEILADRARRPISHYEGFGVLPRAFPLPVVSRLLEVARAAPASSARTGSMAQIAVLTAKTGDPDGGLPELLAEVRSLIDPRSSTERWAGDRYVDPNLIKYETFAAESALLDLALAVGATDSARGLALAREAEAMAAPDDAVYGWDRYQANQMVSKVLGRLTQSVAELNDQERRIVESAEPAYVLGRLEERGRSVSPEFIPADSLEWVRTLTIVTLFRRGHVADSIAVASAGGEGFWWVQRLGYLAGRCAEPDRPDALGAVLSAVESLPLGVGQHPPARGQVLRGCLSAEYWNW